VMSMKIGQVISTPPHAWATGGCARVTYELSKELIKRGHDVTIITTDLYKPNERHIPCDNSNVCNNLKIIRCKSLSNWLAWKHKVYLSIELLKYLNMHLSEYDVVHLQDLISIHAAATAVLCNIYNIPYVLTTHGSVPWLSEKHMTNFLYKISCGKFILKHASKIVALNEMEVDQYKKIGVGEQRLEVIPNGVPLTNIAFLPKIGEFRTKYGIINNEKIILYLGRLHKIKGIELLLDAYSDIKDNLNLVLVIAGPDDGYLKEIQNKIKCLKFENNIILTGPIYDSDKFGAYIDADVYVLPSSYEIFGITVLEACACGTPVIVTDRCGIADVIDNQAGLVVPYDKDCLRDTILHMLSEDKVRQNFGENGKLLVRERFNWEKIAEQVERVYLNYALSKNDILQKDASRREK
jgi:glycosyltransferase involved in cell wall biosynthesis